MSENGKIYTAGKNFTLPPAVTAVTNSTPDFTLQFEGGCIFLKGFCKTILFSPLSDKEEMIGSAFVSFQYRHLKSE